MLPYFPNTSSPPSSSQAGGSVWVAGSSSSSAATGDHQHVIKAALNTKTDRLCSQGRKDNYSGSGVRVLSSVYCWEALSLQVLIQFFYTYFYLQPAPPAYYGAAYNAQAGGISVQVPMHTPRLALYLSFIMFLVIKVLGLVYCIVDAGSPPWSVIAWLFCFLQ